MTEYTNNHAGRTQGQFLLKAGMILFLLAGLCTQVFAQPSLHPPLLRDSTLSIPPIRVLFIGNSYTFYNDLPVQLQQIAASMRETRTIQTERVVVGGRSLKQHWEDTVALAAVRRGGWDYVILQEHSLGALNAPDTMRKYIGLFNQEIRKTGAQTVLYMTWARQHRPESQDTIARMYTGIGREIRALVAPVGLAWQRVRREYPAIVLFDPDGTHPSPEGSYLAACMFYAMFYVRAPLGADCDLCVEKDSTPVNLVNIVYSEANVLQRIAWETYLRYTFAK